MKRILIAAIAAALTTMTSSAQGLDFFNFGLPGFGIEQTQKESKAIKMAYDLDFQYYFDNRENTVSKDFYSPSMTINAARLTPSIGIDINQSRTLSHRLMIGIDILKNMGESPTGTDDQSLNNWDLFKEITMYYRAIWTSGRSKFKAYAGIFPSNVRSNNYTSAFISDSLKFYNNNLEGALVKMERPNAEYEIGCDWLGMYGSKRRERFIIFSYGEGRITDLISAGWTFTGYHYANAVEYGGVVDNDLLKGFLRFDFGKYTNLQYFYSTLGGYIGYQCDRETDNGIIHPRGFENETGICNWNIGINNRLYYGTSMAPYYTNRDSGGYSYSNRLYFRDPYYRIHRSADVPWDQFGAYNRTEIFWEPYFSNFVSLKIAAVFHFAGDFKTPGDFGFAGWQQVVSIKFNLDNLLHPENKVRSIYDYSGGKRLHQKSNRPAMIPERHLYL